jgi:hypothetical protein
MGSTLRSYKSEKGSETHPYRRFALPVTRDPFQSEFLVLGIGRRVIRCLTSPERRSGSDHSVRAGGGRWSFSEMIFDRVIRGDAVLKRRLQREAHPFDDIFRGTLAEDLPLEVHRFLALRVMREVLELAEVGVLCPSSRPEEQVDRVRELVMLNELTYLWIS